MIKSLKSTVFSAHTIIGFVLSITAAYFLFPNNFDMGIYPMPVTEFSWQTLDPSWVSAINYIKIQDLNWGKDFAFTLGPLSYLTTRVGWGQERIGFLLFDLFFFINFTVIFFINYKNSTNKYLTSFLIVVLALVLPSYFGSISSFILLAFLLFWIRYSIDSKSIASYVFQAIIVVLLFFIKFNTGLISFVLFGAGIFYKIVFKKDNPLYLLGYFTAPLILIFIVSGYLNVHIPEYIKSALQIVSGYNEVMYLNRSLCDKHLFALIILLSALGIIFYKMAQEGKKEFFKNIFILFLFSVPIYVLFKQAFVRADESHMKEFFYCSVLLMFCLYDFHLQQKNKYAIFFICVSGLISIYFVNKLDAYAFNFEAKTSKKNYFEGYKSFTPNSGFHLFPNNNQLPQSVLNRVGNNTIDSYPWNTQILLENKLNFTPRPVFQSYTAYTSKLEQKNFDFYNSEKAPKFVLYDFEAIDDRYPLFDEPKLNLIFKQNYTCVDTLVVNSRKTLLLEKKASAQKIKFVQIKEYAIYLDTPLVPQEGIYYEVFVYRNLLGDFMSVIDHGPNILLAVVRNDGEVRKYKTSNKLLETGVFSTQHIKDTNEFRSLLEGDNKEQNQVKAYYFEPKNKTFFKDKIRIKEYKITQ